MIYSAAALVCLVIVALSTAASCLGSPDSLGAQAVALVQVATLARWVDLPVKGWRARDRGVLVMVSVMATMRSGWTPLELEVSGARVKWSLVAVAFSELARSRIGIREGRIRPVDRLAVRGAGLATLSTPVALLAGVHYLHAVGVAILSTAVLCWRDRWEAVAPLGIVAYAALVPHGKASQQVFDVAYFLAACMTAATARTDRSMKGAGR